MRIGVLTSSYPRRIGDHAGRFVAELSAALGRQGHFLEVIAPAPVVSEDPQITVVPVPVGQRLRSEGGMPEQLFAPNGRSILAWAEALPLVWQLGRACHRAAGRWDAIVSHWLVPSAAVAALWGRGLPHLAVAHSSDVHLLRRHPLLARACLGLLASTGARLVLSSEALRNELLSVLRGPALRLLEAATVERMGVTLRGQPCRSPRRSRLRVLFLGRMVPVKGVHHLIDAAAGLDLELWCAGDGPERESLETLAATRGIDARFLGQLDESEKWKVLAQADVLVLPSVRLGDGRTDSAPVVLLEAMAQGALVIATNVGGNAELLTHGEDGLLVPAGDVLALRSALERAADPKLYRQLTMRAWATVQRYDWQHTASRLLALMPTRDRCRT